jgi:hypothetical protein
MAMVIKGTNITVTNGAPDQVIFILAPTHKKFREWCMNNGLDSRSKKVKYLVDPAQLWYRVNCWYKDIGTSFEKGQEFYPLLDKYVTERGFRKIP